jgi:glycosyltransferase involved in cell wall biosynthesis
LRILALEAFYGGSHRAFIDAWRRYSRHEIDIINLPDNFWRWRMRHSAIHFANELKSEEYLHKNYDAVFCSSLTNLAEFKSLAPSQSLPSILYFHENQLEYPVHDNKKRDVNTILGNIVSALAADEVWFNSDYNRKSFLNGLPDFLKLMPDNHPMYVVDEIQAKSAIFPLGIEPPGKVREHFSSSIPHIIWAARWEHDKNPRDFFKALRHLANKGIDFKLSVVGEQFASSPKIFARAKDFFEDRIVYWGFLPSREEYMRALSEADIIVSTAIHEFFGISIVEAIAAGAFPVLPNRLAYPEVISRGTGDIKPFFYEESATDLADRLEPLISEFSTREALWEKAGCSPELIAAPYGWDKVSKNMDDVAEKLIKSYA